MEKAIDRYLVSGLKRLSKEDITEEMCYLTLEKYKNDNYYEDEIKYIPDWYFEKNAYEIVKISPSLLKAIPIKYITQELVNISVSKEIDTFIYVPEKFKTYEMCLKFADEGWMYISNDDIPEKFKTRELYNKLIIKHKDFKLYSYQYDKGSPYEKIQLQIKKEKSGIVKLFNKIFK